MPSFDIVSEIDNQELDNAVNQAKKELANRYDLRGSSSEIEWNEKEKLITLKANEEVRVHIVRDILQTKLHKRGIEISSVKFEKPEPIGGMMLKQVGKIIQGIDKEKAKEIIKSVKESKLKVQAQIMDEQIRVTSKSIDELQETMNHCRGQKFGIPIQFINMRS
jgi:uncharacterized protein YajQ (UPF0234 family)